MDVFRIGKFEIRNRLFVGTGKYASYELMQQALDANPGVELLDLQVANWSATEALEKTNLPTLYAASHPGRFHGTVDAGLALALPGGLLLLLRLART